MRVLLITSPDTRRRVIPKRNRIKGMAGHRAAPLGRYRYDKRRRNGRSREALVEYFRWR